MMPVRIENAERKRPLSPYQPLGPVRGQVVVTVALLPEHTLGGYVVVGIITGKVPVFDQRHEHSTSFPPGAGQLSGNLPGLVAIIVTHHIIGSGCCRIFDLFYN